MESLKIVLVLLVSSSLHYLVECHTYHFGTCPVLEPMPGFSMEKLLGKWYAVQKTSTSSRCLEYNFSKLNEPNMYELEQISENSFLGLIRANNYHYFGTLKANAAVPSKMVSTFPLSIAGKSSFVVIATDYVNYAAVYACQKILFGNRHSLTILSRTKHLEEQYVRKVRDLVAPSNVNPYDMSIIDQTKCSNVSSIRWEMSEKTFSPENISATLRSLGSKVVDGIEYLIKVYMKVHKYFFRSAAIGLPDDALSTETDNQQ